MKKIVPDPISDRFVFLFSGKFLQISSDFDRIQQKHIKSMIPARGAQTTLKAILEYRLLAAGLGTLA